MTTEERRILENSGCILKPMPPAEDARIRELLEENARLRAQLLNAKAMQFKLFMLLPTDRISELLAEYLEHYNDG